MCEQTTSIDSQQVDTLLWISEIFVKLLVKLRSVPFVLKSPSSTLRVVLTEGSATISELVLKSVNQNLS
jgi:hypothetical protein